MRALIWIIAIFALAAGVAMLAGANEGYVLLVLPPWRAQASLNLVVVALLLGFFSVYFLLRLFSKALDLPGRVGAFRSRRQSEKASRSLRDALSALFEGRYGEALKLAKTAHAAGDKAHEAALVAARAAHGMKDEKRYREWIGRAGESAAGRSASLMTEAELALDAGRHDEAEQALTALRKSGNRNAAVAAMRLELAQALNRWEEVPELVQRLRDDKLMTPEQARSLLRHAHIERLRGLVGDAEQQAAYWRSLGKDDMVDPDLVVQALPLLAEAGQGAIARRAVERLLDARWRSDLARRYVLCAGDGDEAKDALSRAEKWLNQHPDDAGLLYAVGRQCMSARIWGKAQSYLEASASKEPAADVNIALAELMEQLDRPNEAKKYYCTAARLAIA